MNALKIANGLILDFTIPTIGVGDSFLSVASDGTVTKTPIITVDKITAQTASRVAVYNTFGFLVASSVTTTELGYVSGVTSPLQAQLNAKQATISLTINRAVVSNGAGVLAVSATTDTEIGYSSGVTSAIQTQLNAKQATITGGATTIVSANLTVNRALVSDGSGKVAVSAVTSTELGYSSGVTSALQTQLNGKLSVTITSPTSGQVITYNGSAWVNSSSAAVGVPVGGSTGQYLIKNSGTNYDTVWHTLVAADLSNVTSTAAELNLLHGVTTSTVQFNYLSTVTSDVQSQLNARLINNLALNAIWIGNASNIAIQLSAGTSGYVLTSVSGVPTWQPAPGGGAGIAGPGTSTLNAVVRWSNTLGTVVKDSPLVVTDAGLMTGGTWNGNKIGLVYGGTNADLSATGGTAQYLKQSTAGAAITVGTIPATDIASGAALTKSDDTNVTMTLGGAPTTALLTATSLTLGWTGTLAYARLVNGAGLSVIGRASNSAGVQADITAGTDAFVLRRSGTSIGFGTIGDASISDLAWTKISGTPTTLSGYGITDGVNKYWTLNPQGSSYTFVLSDNNSALVQATSASSTNFTIPPNASVAYPIGSELALVWDGTGTPSWVAGAGVTINSSSGDLTIPSRYSVTIATKVATNTWYLWNGAAFAVQTANTVFAGPTSGGSATPTFRALVSTDIPTLGISKITMNTAKLLGRTTASTGAVEEIAVGGGLTLASTTLSWGGALAGNVLLDGSYQINIGSVTPCTGFFVRDSGAGLISLVGGGFAVTSTNVNIASGTSFSVDGAINVGFGQGTQVTTFKVTATTVAINLGSDAIGDIYQRNASGNFTRLAAVATGNVLISGGVATINAWGKVGLTTHVSGILPLANGGTASNLTDPNANTIMAWDDTDNTVGFWTLGTGLTYTHATHTLSAAGGGGGITNTAANNELMKSDGVNAVPSGTFSTAAGDLTFGTGLTGTVRTLKGEGSGSNIDVVIMSKGTGVIQFSNPSSSAYLAFSPSNNSLVFGPGAAVIAPASNVATGDNLAVHGGDGITNGNGGSLYLNGGTKAGAGTSGNIGFFVNSSGTFGGGEKVVFFANATTNPTTNPTGGGIMFVKSADNKPYWRTPAGVETIMLGGTGGITNTAAANEIMKSDGTNAVPSGVFSTVGGDLTFGTGLSGANRTFTAAGSATDVGFAFTTKAAGGFTFTTSGAGGVLFNVDSLNLTKPAFPLQSLLISVGLISRLDSGTVGILQLQSSQGNSGSATGGDIWVAGGAGYNSGNTNGGNVYLKGGVKNASGVDGNIGLNTTSGSFGGGGGIVFIANAITKPSSNPTGGSILYPDGSNASDPTVRLPSGEIIDLAIHVGTTAPSAPITGQLWVDTN